MFKLGVALLLLSLATIIQAKSIPVKPPKLCRAHNKVASPCYTVVRTIPKYDIEERKYASGWWVSTRRIVSAPLQSKVSYKCYLLLRDYLRAHNATMGVPVTYTVKAVPNTAKVDFTMSFYLPNTKRNVRFQPPTPHIQGVLLEKKPSMSAYVKVFKGLRPYERFSKRYAQQLSNELKKEGLNGKFITPDVKYIAAGYDGPWVRLGDRINEFWLQKV